MMIQNVKNYIHTKKAISKIVDIVINTNDPKNYNEF